MPEETPQGNTLLLASAIGSGARSTCLEMLSTDGFSETKAIHVLYMESAVERYQEVDEHCRAHPDQTAVIAVGSGGVVGQRGPDPPGDYYVQSLTDAADLTGLGMALNDCLSEWDDPDTDLVCCFDSLTILLQYAELDRVFRCLHMLTTMLSDVDARAHFHLDPAAHDEEDVAKLAQVFDQVLEIDDVGARPVSL